MQGLKLVSHQSHRLGAPSFIPLLSECFGFDQVADPILRRRYPTRALRKALADMVSIECVLERRLQRHSFSLLLQGQVLSGGVNLRFVQRTEVLRRIVNAPVLFEVF